ncbi:MAG: hypothetical protein AAGI52_13190 [Bacteroidota bacterium]
MRLRSALAALAATLVLVGCDLAGSNDAVSGYWEGTSEFVVDTLITGPANVNVKSEYTMTFSFDLSMDDGLVSGDVVARREGFLILREAVPGGVVSDTFRFNQEVAIPELDLTGTFLEPELEVDPVIEPSPYEADMWTFEVVGSRAETSDFIRNEWTFTNIQGEEYQVPIRSRETFVMRLTDPPEDEPGEGGIGSLQTQRWRAALRALDAAD